jgi:hypothetical protein
MAQTFGTRPSAILGLRDEWIAFQVDQAVHTAGLYVSNKLNERDRRGKAIWTLKDILAGNTGARPVQAGTIKQVFGRKAVIRHHPKRDETT